jgi:hypothetical protein
LGPPSGTPPGSASWQAWAGTALVAGAALAVWDYTRVAAIFKATAGAAPLAQRIAAGQASVFFGHHADYAAVTSGQPLADPAAAFARATHYLLDTRLMIAWAEALARNGDEQAARHVADRLREFRKAEAADFFAVCNNAAAPPAATGAAVASAPPGAPFPCQPTPPLPWRALPMAGP